MEIKLKLNIYTDISPDAKIYPYAILNIRIIINYFDQDYTYNFAYIKQTYLIR